MLPYQITYAFVTQLSLPRVFTASYVVSDIRPHSFQSEYPESLIVAYQAKRKSYNACLNKLSQCAWQGRLVGVLKPLACKRAHI